MATDVPMSKKQAVLTAVICTALVVGLLAFGWGAYSQSRKDACEVAKATNILGLNSASVVEYCS
jgi:hypothetical protein